MIRRLFGAAILLAGMVDGLGAVAQPAERPAMIRLVAAAENDADGRCAGAVFVINDSRAAITPVISGLSWLDERDGSRKGESQDLAPGEAPAGETVRVAGFDLPVPCARLRAVAGDLRCGEAACAAPVLGESRGLAGFRMPAGLARGLGNAVAQAPRPRIEALATPASSPAPDAAASTPAAPAATPSPMPALEPDTDRQGNDYRTDELAGGGAAACQALCLGEAMCRAFTFVPAAEGNGAGACWLKDGVPDAFPSGGMVSGVVRPDGASHLVAQASSDASAVAASPAADAPPAEPAPNMRPGWAEMRERVENGPEGDLVVRYGDIDNLGFGWAEGFDPFTGAVTDAHHFPFTPSPADPPGTDRILLGTGVVIPLDDRYGDGYHEHAERPAATPPEMRIPLAPLPAEMRQVLVQFFVDDFQSPVFESRFQVTLNGRRLPNFETVFNALNQSGPVGKLVSLRLLPEFFPLLAGGEAVFRIDDPDSGGKDGFAIDFIRVLVNPRIIHPATITARVLELGSDSPIAGALVEAGLSAGRTDAQGHVQLEGVPAGLVAVTANREGYDGATEMQDAVAGETVEVTLYLPRRQETASALRQEVERRGRATIRGIHFDFDRDTPRADSLPALEALQALIEEMKETAWVIEGHTDGVGGAAHNRRLSQARAEAVIAWLVARGIESSRLTPRGLGPDQPLADNATDEGRALNRRVEAVPLR
ncbi:OmpA family protein [Roseomonas terrae]|uniref:OmpA family protein n=1 Tax=Neoroseomonas terrae TaxID=424799 RepID=A0ABS5EM38_9PROT|nr:OmpA family protein [Neoroseomonas terrae]MBR0652082.1 OmpA family protein [Neoroseomonas terrae]